MVDAWKYFDNERYDLIAYVVMPNHVHLLIKTYETWPLGDLVKSWKRQSTKMIRRTLGVESAEGAIANRRSQAF